MDERPLTEIAASNVTMTGVDRAPYEIPSAIERLHQAQGYIADRLNILDNRLTGAVAHERPPEPDSLSEIRKEPGTAIAREIETAIATAQGLGGALDSILARLQI